MQEPALEKITARVQKVDAIAERELAERFAIFTVPSTVVIGADGTAANVNYGYADAAKLRRQLTAAGQKLNGLSSHVGGSRRGPLLVLTTPRRE